MPFKKLQCHGGYYSGKGKVTMREAWILMEAPTGEWTADGDNSAMVVFFSLFDDKNHNVGGNSTVSNGLINKLFVYQKTTVGFTLLNTYTTNFKLWGIHMDGNDLYAVADLTGDIVQFKNFMNNASGSITPTKRVTIEGLIRTHGITYSASDDVMILTDVASAASATDGGLIVIKNYELSLLSVSTLVASTVFASATIVLASSTFLVSGDF